MGKFLRLMPLLIILLGVSSAGLATYKPVFTAHLNGAEQVPAFDTTAQGQFILKNRDGSLEYKLIVANLANVVAAHIHCAPVGTNGPVGVTLFAGAPTAVSGILASGPILAPDTGNACGWTNVADIIAGIASGNTYINVHTLQSLSGEIRGQVR